MRIALNWYDNGNERRDEFKKMIKQILEQSADESVALQMDVIVGNLVREGINKHRARELAEHFIKYTRPQPAAPDWGNVGRLIEAAHRANGAGHLTGTSNWAAAVCAYMLTAAPEQKGNV